MATNCPRAETFSAPCFSWIIHIIFENLNGKFWFALVFMCAFLCSKIWVVIYPAFDLGLMDDFFHQGSCAVLNMKSVWSLFVQLLHISSSMVKMIWTNKRAYMTLYYPLLVGNWSLEIIIKPQPLKSDNALVETFQADLWSAVLGGFYLCY